MTKYAVYKADGHCKVFNSQKSALKYAHKEHKLFDHFEKKENGKWFVALLGQETDSALALGRQDKFRLATNRANTADSCSVPETPKDKVCDCDAIYKEECACSDKRNIRCVRCKGLFHSAEDFMEHDCRQVGCEEVTKCEAKK